MLNPAGAVQLQQQHPEEAQQPQQHATYTAPIDVTKAVPVAVFWGLTSRITPWPCVLYRLHRDLLLLQPEAVQQPG